MEPIAHAPVQRKSQGLNPDKELRKARARI